MNCTRARILVIQVAAVFMLAGCAEYDGGSMMGGTAPPAAPATAASAPQTATPSGPRPASGTQEDSLEACLARIPSNASAGQRMVAELSCQRDEANRKPIKSVPGI